jgi:hypothetical protein
MTWLLVCWLALGVLCYGIVLVGAFRARHTQRAGFGGLALLLTPVLIVVAPLLVLRALLRRRQLAQAASHHRRQSRRH